MIKTIKKWSSSLWEDSYFGGYNKVLIDHPFIVVPDSIKIDMPSTYSDKEISKDLSEYTAQKLCKIFLLKVNNFGLGKRLFENAKIEKETNLFGKEVIYYVTNPTSVKEVLNTIIATESEIFNLFINYQKFLENVNYLFEIPNNNDPENEDDDPDESYCEELSRKALTKVAKGKAFSSGFSQNACDSALKDQVEFITIREGNSTKYTSEETFMANRLLNMLDISFDMKEDRVHNLKTGKLDTSKIAEIPAGNTHVHYRVEEEQSTKPFSICILMDESGSMQYRGIADDQRSLVKTLYKAFSQILPLNKIYIYGHTGDDTPNIYVYNDKYNHSFEKTIEDQRNRDYCENYDGPVIDSIYDKIRGYTDDSMLMLVISDGEPSGRGYGGEMAIDELKRVIEKCKRDKFICVGVGINYAMNGIGEIYNYHTMVTPENMVKNISTLLNRVVKTEFKD